MPSYPAPMSLQIDDLILPMVPEEEYTLPAPRTSPHPWPPRLPLDLALGAESQQQILDRYSISDDDFTRWALTPAFRRAVAEAARTHDAQVNTDDAVAVLAALRQWKNEFR